MCKRNSDQIQLQKLVKLFKQILTKKKLNLNNSSPPHLPLFFLSKHQFSLFYFTPLFHSVDLTCFFNEKSRHKITAITHNSRKIRINNFTSFGQEGSLKSLCLYKIPKYHILTVLYAIPKQSQVKVQMKRLRQVTMLACDMKDFFWV